MMSDSPEVRCLRADIDSMIEIISGFLSYSKDQISESRAKYNLFNLLKDVKNQYIANDIRINGNKQIKIFVKLASFKRALNNIISNAVRYAKIVFISFTQSDDRVIISIEDDGIGIKEELIETIFDPFVSDNRNFQTKTNTGLGLSIAKEIITSHGGTISAKKSKRHGGAKFIITLPSSHQISL
jgi:two-component system osmolarity sensor histidine kinase EnvZ